SRREPPFVGWVAIDEFEDLVHRLCGLRITVPATRWILPSGLGQIRDNFLGPFVSLDDRTSEGELLLVVARAPSDLRMVRTVRDARKRFRNIAGFVIDSYFTE